MLNRGRTMMWMIETGLFDSSGVRTREKRGWIREWVNDWQTDKMEILNYDWTFPVIHAIIWSDKYVDVHIMFWSMTYFIYDSDWKMLYSLWHSISHLNERMNVYHIRCLHRSWVSVLRVSFFQRWCVHKLA